MHRAAPAQHTASAGGGGPPGACKVQLRTCLYQTGAKLTLRGLGTGFPVYNTEQAQRGDVLGERERPAGRRQTTPQGHTSRSILGAKRRRSGVGRDQPGGGKPHEYLKPA